MNKNNFGFIIFDCYQIALEGRHCQDGWGLMVVLLSTMTAELENLVEFLTTHKIIK